MLKGWFKIKNAFGIYKNGQFLLLIPMVSLLLSIIYYVAYPKGTHENPIGFILNGLTSTTLIWTGCMFIVNVLWKKYPWERHPIKHLILEIIYIFIYLLICLALSLFFMYGLDMNAWSQLISTNAMDAFTTVLITYLITAIHEAFYFYQQWKANFSKSIKLEKENIQAQLNTLKAQVNPHFLFNSLNTLASLVENNPKAEQFVLDLSEYLRFVLNSTTKGTIQLKEELDNLDKYLRLQSIRFGSNLNVTFNIEEEAFDKHLPPLVLQILVENCIKHNAITHSKPLNILVNTSATNLIVQNNLQKITSQHQNGQGLINIIGRYRFLTSEKVIITETSTFFAVEVPLIKVSDE